MALIIRRSPVLQKIAHLNFDASGQIAAPTTADRKPGEGVEAAASVETEGPDVGAVLLGYAGVIAGAAAGWLLYAVLDPKPYVAAAGFSAFAPLYVLAQSIERIMEPFTKYLGSAPDAQTCDTTKYQPEAQRLLEDAVAAMNNGTGTPQTAAKYLALVTRIRRNKTVIAWGIASAAAMILCGVFGFGLLNATGLAVPWGGLDAVLTGLAVGSGTKPLHDLISNLQKSKDAKSDPGEAATTG